MYRNDFVWTFHMTKYGICFFSLFWHIVLSTVYSNQNCLVTVSRTCHGFSLLGFWVNLSLCLDSSLTSSQLVFKVLLSFYLFSDSFPHHSIPLWYSLLWILNNCQSFVSSSYTTWWLLLCKYGPWNLGIWFSCFNHKNIPVRIEITHSTMLHLLVLWSSWKWKSKVPQSCPTLCDPMD